MIRARLDATDNDGKVSWMSTHDCKFDMFRMKLPGQYCFAGRHSCGNLASTRGSSNGHVSMVGEACHVDRVPEEMKVRSVDQKPHSPCSRRFTKDPVDWGTVSKHNMLRPLQQPV